MRDGFCTDSQQAALNRGSPPQWSPLQIGVVIQDLVFVKPERISAAEFVPGGDGLEPLHFGSPRQLQYKGGNGDPGAQSCYCEPANESSAATEIKRSALGFRAELLDEQPVGESSRGFVLVFFDVDWYPSCTDAAGKLQVGTAGSTSRDATHVTPSLKLRRAFPGRNPTIAVLG